MAWQDLPELPGKLYIPRNSGQARKHPCTDCFACQQCSDDRCALCRSAGFSARRACRTVARPSAADENHQDK